MNFQELLQSRKSIRSYTGEGPTDEQLTLVLQAANSAPVGMGRYETIHLSVVTNRAVLDWINDSAAAALGMPGHDFLYGAPMLIVVSSPDTPVDGPNAAYSNVAIVAHTMVLAAVDQGLGACHIWGSIMAISANPEAAERLGLPEGFRPYCGLVLGDSEEPYVAREIPAGRVAVNCVP